MVSFQLNKDAALILRTNNRCVQSLNISVEVAKCVKNIHKFTQYTYFLTVTKND